MSAPAARPEISDPKAYQKKLQSLLEGRDPIDVLAETPAALRKIVAGRSAEELRRPPAPGKWCALEVLGHLLDVEWVYGYRTRTIFSDDKPKIVGMDQDLWVAANRYTERDAPEILDAHAALRAVNVAFWRSIPRAAYDRVGIHSERGEESLGLLLRMAGGHDLTHRAQLERSLAR